MARIRCRVSECIDAHVICWTPAWTRLALCRSSQTCCGGRNILFCCQDVRTLLLRLRLVLFFGCLTLVLLLSVPAYADSATWQGDDGDNWGNGNNWNGDVPNSVSNPADDALFLIIGSNRARRVDVNGNFGFRNLTFNLGGINSHNYNFYSSGSNNGSLSIAGNLSLTGNGSEVVTFENTASLNVTGNSTSWTINNGTLRFDSGSNLGGSGSMTQSGNGTVDLNSANSFSGVYTLSSGTLRLDNENALQNARLNFQGGTLNFDSNFISHNLGGLAGTSNLSLGSTRLRLGARNVDDDFGGDITGNADSRIIKEGNQTQFFSGNTISTGSLSINSGTLAFLDSDVSLTSTNTISTNTMAIRNEAALFISDQSTFNIASTDFETREGAVTTIRDSSVVTAFGIDVKGSGQVNLNSGGQLTGTSLEVGLFGSGNASVTLESDSSIEIAGETALYNAGQIIVDGGSLTTRSLSSTDTGIRTVVNLIGDPSVGDAMTIDGSGNTAFAGRLRGAGQLTLRGSGSLTLSGANNDHTGEVLITGGSGARLIVGHANALQNSKINLVNDDGLDVNGFNATLGGLRGFGDLNIGSTTLTVDGAVSGGGYAGTITGNSNARLVVNSSSSWILGSGADINVDTTLNNASIEIRDTNTFNDSIVTLTGSNTVTLGSATTAFGAIAGTGSMNIPGNRTIMVGTSADSTFSGNLTGTGTITMAGDGRTWTLDGPMDFAGTLDIDTGQVFVGHPDALQNAVVQVDATNGLSTNTDTNIAGLSGGGDLNLNAPSAGREVNIAGSGSHVYSGTFSYVGPARLRYSGTGTQTFTGDDNRFGTLSVDSGTFAIDSGSFLIATNSASEAAGGDLNITNGGSLSASRLRIHNDSVVTVTGSGSSLSTQSNVWIYDGGDLLVLESGQADLGNVFANAASSQQSGAVLGVESGGQVTVTGETSLADTTGTTTFFLVTDENSSYQTQSLNLGGRPSGSTGGSAFAEVLAGGDLSVTGATTFFTNTSTLAIDRATFSTGSIAQTTGVTSSITLNDPTGGVALTVGDSSDWVLNTALNETTGGTASLRKVGTGAMTLGVAPNISGRVIIDEGSIVLGAANHLASQIVEINADAGLNINGLDANLGGLAGSADLNLGTQTVTVGSNDASTTYTGNLTGDPDSNFLKEGTGTLTFQNSTASNFGALISHDGTVTLDNVDMTLTQAIPGIAAVLSANLGGELDIRNGSVINAPNRDLYARNGSGVTISGIGTQVNSRQVFALLADSNLTVELGATIDTSNINLNAKGSTSGTVTATIQSGGRINNAGTIASAEDPGVTAILNVTGENSLVDASRLFLGGSDDANRGGTTTVTIDSGGVMDLSGETRFFSNSSSITVDGGQFITGDLNSHTGITGSVFISDANGTPALTIGRDGFDSVFKGVITDHTSGAGSVRKVGAGTLTLEGANTFTGALNVTGGTLVANNTTGSATGFGTLTIEADAALGGTGNIEGPVIVERGARLAAGNSIGTLTTGDLTWQAGAIHEFEIGSAQGTPGAALGWDLIVIDSPNGELSLNASQVDPIIIELVTLNNGLPGMLNDFDPEVEYRWQLVDAQAITGFDASHFVFDTTNFLSPHQGIVFGLEHDQSTGDLYVLAAIPEPTTVLILATSTVFMLRRTRHA